MNGENREEEIQGAQEPPQPAEPAEPKPLSVDLNEVDDEPEDRGQQQATPERPVRHKSDWRRMKEQHASEMAEMRRELSELRGRLSAPQPVAPQPQAPQSGDPIEAEIDSISRQQDFLLKAINAGQLGEGDQASAIKEWRQLDRKRRALEFKKDVGEQQAPQVQNEDQMIQQIIRMEFPEVFEDDELRTRAQAEMIGLMKRGRAKSLATAREACKRVAPKAGIFGKPPAPTDAERARYSSVPARAGLNGANGSNQFTPNKMQLEIARAYTAHLPDLSDAERVKKWVREVGKPAGLV